MRQNPAIVPSKTSSPSDVVRLIVRTTGRLMSKIKQLPSKNAIAPLVAV